MLLLHITNSNPAAVHLKELFDDGQLRQDTVYLQLMPEVRNFFEQQPGYGPHKQTLYDLLMSPIDSVPGSLLGQLEFIRI